MMMTDSNSVNVPVSIKNIHCNSAEHLSCYILAPSANEAIRYFDNVEIDDASNYHKLNEIYTLRTRVYQREGYVQNNSEQSYNMIDRQAWHIALRNEFTSSWAGCNRMIVYKLDKQSLNAKDVFTLGNVCPENVVVESELLQIIDGQLEEAARKFNPFCYFGGFAIDPNLQGRLYGLRLGVYSRILLNQFDRPLAVTFANMKTRAARLFQHGGWEPLDPVLGPFYCKVHRCEGLFMRWNSEKMRESIKRRVAGAEVDKGMFKVIAPAIE